MSALSALAGIGSGGKEWRGIRQELFFFFPIAARIVDDATRHK